MKVLIIEDNDYKLDNAIRVIGKHEITEYVHVNNYMEACNLLRKGLLDEIDFIILDIQFYETRPLLDSRGAMPDQHAGYKFLLRLASADKTIPVFLFSSIDSFEEGYKEFLFPPFSEYRIKFVSSPIFYRESYYSNRYKEEMKANEEIQKKTLGFVRGHAHNQYELETLIRQYLDSNNHN